MSEDARDDDRVHEIILTKLELRVGYLERTIEALVTKLEFAPVKLLVYGLVGLICSSVVAALVALVVRANAN